MEEKYTEEVQSLLKVIEDASINEEPLEFIEAQCDELIDIGNELNDSYLLGYAYYYKEHTYFLHGNADMTLTEHVNSVPHLIQTEQYSKLVKSYNNMGIIAVSRNNYSLAIENFLSSIDLCKEHHFDYDEGITYNNMGEMYKSNGDYHSAIGYYRKALKICCTAEPTTPYFYSNLLLIYSALLFCYVKTNNEPKATECYEKLISLNDKAEDNYHMLAFVCTSCRYFYSINKPEKATELMNQIIEYIGQINSIYDFYVYIIDVCDILLETQNYKALIDLAHTIENRMIKSNDNSPFIESNIYHYKIIYYKQLGNTKHLNNALRNYYNAKLKQDAYIKKFTKTLVDSQLKINEQNEKHRKTMESIELLKKHVKHDQLTGLYNYAFIKDSLETLFQEAAANSQTLAVAIIDIDFFKEYNDTYGHQQGDLAIKSVANELQSIQSDNIICSRYGGDEFIIIFSGMQDNEIINWCNKIRHDIYNANIAHISSKISDRLSVSIGVRNSIPHKQNKTWDFLYAADMALYDVKEFHKSGLQLVHRYLTPKSKTGNKDNKLTIM